MYKKYKYIVGIDEVGRGALCGPVVASCVCLLNKLPFKAKDSKQLTPKQRESYFEVIKDNSLYSFGLIGQDDIDKVNIFWATQKAFLKAIKQFFRNHNLEKEDVLFIVDGQHFKHQGFNAKCIIGADRDIQEVCCASILAKVLRDRIMVRYDKIFSGWNFSRHKGYGTKEHRTLIKEKGLSPLHRKSFSCNLEGL